jgi:signal transduction histidine kinase
MRTWMELTATEERLQTGCPLSNPAPLDLPALSEQALGCLDPSSVARVRIETVHPLPPLRGDARLLMFAVLNLIDNAIKYSPDKTAIDIRIAPSAGERGVNWCIRNAGDGIPTESEKRIFEKYHRLDESSARPGLGLGLPISRQIAEKHGGRLSLVRSDTAGEGVCFCIWLPEAV